MFAITEGTRKVYGKEITTYTREIYCANVLEAEAGTNGFHGEMCIRDRPWMIFSPSVK